MLIYILTLIALVIGILIGALIVTYYPLPVPLADKGHRLFGVQDKRALTVLKEIMSKHGVKERWSMTFGPTHQTVMMDHQTVLCWFDPDTIPEDEMNAVSLVCAQPTNSAIEAIAELQAHGFSAQIKQTPGTDSDNFCVVKTNAFINTVLAFRKHVLKMPKPEIE